MTIFDINLDFENYFKIYDTDVKISHVCEIIAQKKCIKSHISLLIDLVKISQLSSEYNMLKRNSLLFTIINGLFERYNVFNIIINGFTEIKENTKFNNIFDHNNFLIVVEISTTIDDYETIHQFEKNKNNKIIQNINKVSNPHFEPSINIINYQHDINNLIKNFECFFLHQISTKMDPNFDEVLLHFVIKSDSFIKGSVYDVDITSAINILSEYIQTNWKYVCNGFTERVNKRINYQDIDQYILTFSLHIDI